MLYYCDIDDLYATEYGTVLGARPTGTRLDDWHRFIRQATEELNDVLASRGMPYPERIGQPQRLTPACAFLAMAKIFRSRDTASDGALNQRKAEECMDLYNRALANVSAAGIRYDYDGDGLVNVDSDEERYTGPTYAGRA
jgi:hypothetical protein